MRWNVPIETVVSTLKQLALDDQLWYRLHHVVERQPLLGLRCPTARPSFFLSFPFSHLMPIPVKIRDTIPANLSFPLITEPVILTFSIKDWEFFYGKEALYGRRYFKAAA